MFFVGEHIRYICQVAGLDFISYRLRSFHSHFRDALKLWFSAHICIVYASERARGRVREPERERDYIIRLNGSVWTNKQHQPRVHPAYNCIYIVLIFGGDYSPPQQITGTRLNWLSFDHTLERRSLSRTWVCASSSPVRSSYLVIDMYSYSVCRVHCNTS